MNWIIYAFISAFFAATSIIISKKVLKKEHSMEFSATLKFILLLFSLSLLPFIDFSIITPKQIIFTAIISIFSVIAFLALAKAIRHAEVSSISPLLVLSPGVIAIISFVFLKEPLTFLQISGISLLIVGAYVLESKNHQRILDPFRNLVKSKWSKYALLTVLLYGFSSTFERYLLGSLKMEVPPYLFLLSLFMAINLFILLTIFHNGYKGVVHGLKKGKVWIAIIAFLTFAMLFSQFQAVATTQASLVIAIKRTSTLLVIILGGEFFHEKNILKKILASIIMIAGVILIAI
jgi:drug/metabolite transporter (DMT)-like permease